MAYKKSEETRGRILEAASRLFAEKGYYETGMADIARAANIGHASIYYHFDTKEKVARALFDSIAEKIGATAEHILGANEDLLLTMMVNYILLFKFIALNKATQAVYYDLVQFANYDRANIDRLRMGAFRDTPRLFAQYGVELSEEGLVAIILTSDAFSKAMFKGILHGLLDFSLMEATDYFCRHMLLCELPIPEAEYKEKLSAAFRLCEGIELDR